MVHAGIEYADMQLMAEACACFAETGKAFVDVVLATFARALSAWVSR
jgi:6-phosphogluconate dehydrogenase